jgi:hypothetical protein
MYEDLNMSEVFDDWEEYEESLMAEIYADPACREALREALEVSLRWNEEYELDEEDEDEDEEDWEDMEDDCHP